LPTDVGLLDTLTYALVILTVTLAVITAVVGIRAENRLNKVISVLTSLGRMQFIYLGTVVRRTVEVPVSSLTKDVNLVIQDINVLGQLVVTTRIVNNKLEVEYMFNREDQVYRILRAVLTEPTILPEEVYSRLMH